MDTLKDKCAIAGIGWTRYSRNSGASVLSLALEACQNAILDAGLVPKDIDSVVCYHMGDSVAPTEVATGLGLPGVRYLLEYWAGGHGACATVINAAMAVACGLARNVLVFRAMNGRSGFRMGGTGVLPDTWGEQQFLVPYGWTTWPQSMAVLARRYMCKYGVTSRQLGAVAVTGRRYASLNERAMMRQPITIEDHQSSRMIVEPFRLLDVCLETDGACAVVVTSAERARHLRHRPVYIMGAAQGGGPYPGSSSRNCAGWLRVPDHADLYSKYIAASLYAMAGVTPRDINVAEIYDCFTVEPIIQLEDFGFCKKGEGGAFVEEGRIGLGGEIPVNTHGGLLSEGYIHGLNHVVEAVSQLRGDAGPRQVKDAELALVSAVGVSHGSGLILRRG